MINAPETTDIFHHIGLINSNLDVSAACYERLGFTLTPLSIPKVPLTPRGLPETLGAGNRHAIFSNNYLELLGILDPGRWKEITIEQRGPYDLDLPLSRYEGLHVMHFGTDHIEKVKERLDKQGVICSAIKHFQRNVQTKTGERIMKARSIHFAPESNPEGLIQIAQHDTPELVFQDQYMRHPNGALSLIEIMIATETPASLAQKYERYSGHQSRQVENNHFVIDLGFSRITVVDPDGLQTIIPGYKVKVLPFMAGVTVEVANLKLLFDLLTGNNVPFTQGPGSVVVHAENACGCAIIFKEYQK